MSRGNKLLISVFLLVLVFLLTPPCSSTDKDADDDDFVDVESSKFKVKDDESEFKVKDDESEANSELLINLMKKNTGDVVASKRAKREIITDWADQSLPVILLLFFGLVIAVVIFMLVCMAVGYIFLRRPGESFSQFVARDDAHSRCYHWGDCTDYYNNEFANRSKNANQEARNKETTERYNMEDLKNDSASKERLLGESGHSYGTDEASGRDKKSKSPR